MDNEKLKVVVENLEGNSLRVGNEMIELEDHTSSKFRTKSIEDFICYIHSIDPNGSLTDIYFDNSAIKAFPRETNRYSESYAVCGLETSRALKCLMAIESESLNLNQFEQKMRLLCRYGNDSALDLFSWVKNFELKTVNNIQRKKSHDGSYMLHISREKAEKESYSPPKRVIFDVPIFKWLEIKLKLVFDFYFDYTNHEDKIDTSFKLVNVSLEEEVEIARKCVLFEVLKNVPNNKYFGEISKSVADDSWKYLENAIK